MSFHNPPVGILSKRIQTRSAKSDPLSPACRSATHDGQDVGAPSPPAEG